MRSTTNLFFFFLVWVSQIYKIPVEVALMHKALSGPESVGNFAAVSLLDWYYLDQDLILVTERPVPSEVLTTYLDSQGGIIEEQEAKVLKLCVCVRFTIRSCETLQSGMYVGNIKLVPLQYGRFYVQGHQVEVEPL